MIEDDADLRNEYILDLNESETHSIRARGVKNIQGLVNELSSRTYDVALIDHGCQGKWGSQRVKEILERLQPNCLKFVYSMMGIELLRTAVRDGEFDEVLSGPNLEKDLEKTLEKYF